MITVNNTILNKILSPVREIYARVELYEGSTLISTYNPTDRLIKFEIQRVGDTSKFFGFGICQKLNFHLIDKDRELNITTANSVRISYTMDKQTYVYPYPTFYVSEVHRDENTNQLSVTAYDRLLKASKFTIDDMNLVAPYTLTQFVNKAAATIGAGTNVKLVNFTNTTAFSHNFATGGNLEGIELIRDILDDAAEFTQSIYYIDSTDCLTFKRLDRDSSPLFTITKDHYITLTSKTNRRLSALCRATELGDNITASIEASGTTQYLRDNVFYDVLEGSVIGELLDNAITLMGGLCINQFDCSWRGNFYLEVGDKIGLVNKNNEIVHSFILDDTVTYDGSLNVMTAWSYTNNEEETASNPTTIGDKLNQTYAKVDKVNKEIELLASKFEESDVNGLSQEIAQLKLTTEDITARVSKIEENSGEDEDITTLKEDVAELKITNNSITQRVSALEENNVAGEIGTMKQEIAELKVDTEGITQEVSRIEQSTNESLQTISHIVSQTVTPEDVKILVKQEVINNDLDATSVTTETGYTFNKNGLTVSKSGSEMTTQITEDGMTVQRSGETVLTADSDGVYAVNLHATTYLLVGETSRFEDYNDGGVRTGCFWTGR